MRILVISDKLLDTATGDGLRVRGLLSPLRQRHTFDLIAMAKPGDALDSALGDLFAEVTTVPVPATSREPLPVRAFKAATVGNLKPVSVEMQLMLQERLASGRYGLVLEIAANTVVNFPKDHAGVPLVVDAIDEPLLRDLRALRTGPMADRARLLVKAWRFWSYERTYLNRATLIIYAAEDDARVYSRFFPKRRVAVVPNGVDTTFFHPQSLMPEPDTVVFEGNMNFPPNVDAARRLVQEVLPALKAMRPAARVVLVGRDPAPPVLALASADVAVTGTVKDVRPFLARGAVFSCPMHLGSGIKNKILQAWAMARPVVASSASLGGLSAQDGRQHHREELASVDGRGHRKPDGRPGARDDDRRRRQGHG